tara:strand:+ start:2676 stop:3161 length:486 start_codon:yes stop_codon:yes gene_type:complete
MPLFPDRLNIGSQDILGQVLFQAIRRSTIFFGAIPNFNCATNAPSCLGKERLRVRTLSIKIIFAAIASSTSFFGSFSGAAAQADWTFWKHNSTSPGQVAVAQTGSLNPPWVPDSSWNGDLYGALKKACWMVRNGDISGRRYRSPQMESGQISCDANCNCRF